MIDAVPTGASFSGIMRVMNGNTIAYARNTIPIRLDFLRGFSVSEFSDSI